VNLYHGELDPQFGEHQQARARSLYEDQDFSKTHTVEVCARRRKERRKDGTGNAKMNASRNVKEK